MLGKKHRRVVSYVLIWAMVLSMLIPSMSWGAGAAQFKDIEGSYAKKEIQALVDDGILGGYEDGSFQPSKAISRAELAKLIVLSLGLKEKAEAASAFTDVNADSWYRGFVGALVDSGITQGTSATTFSPESKVTREELVVFFIRALRLEETAGKLTADAKLSDLKQVSSWAQAHVSLAFKIGFVNGVENKDGSLSFNPKEQAERQALARLAYEFKNNKTKFVDKANELVKGNTAGAATIVGSAEAINITTVQITLTQPITAVDKADFTFDNGLTVSSAELKSGANNVVVLTTSLQTVNTVYKLSYKGVDTGKTITGVESVVSGGGGGGRSSSGNSSSPQALINSGGTLTDLTLNMSGTFGPESGKTTITGTLTLNPGESGEITLKNVDANKVVVLSGSPNSIKFKNSKVQSLQVKADNQSQKVRVVALEGAQVVTTSVYSQAIIEAASGTLGDITVSTGAANPSVVLRGTINGSVTVLAADAQIKLEAPVENPNGQTKVGLLNVTGNASIAADDKTDLEAVNITSKNSKVIVQGTGVIHTVTIAPSAAGATLSINADSNVQSIQANGDFTLEGDVNQIGKITINVGEGVKVSASDELKAGLAKLAIQAIDAIGTFAEYSKDTEDRIIAAEIAASNALKLGMDEASITNYAVLNEAKQQIASLKQAVQNDLSEAKSNTAIQFAAGDTAESVTSNLKLPLIGLKGTSISWSSSNTNVVGTDGTITRPAAGQADAVVILTAIIAKQGLTTSKTFTVTVKANADVSAETYGTISGYAVGALGDPMDQPVTVTIAGTSLKATTDTNGLFTIPNVPAGKSYTVAAALEGFTGASVDGISVSTGKVTTLEKPLMLKTGSTGSSRLYFDSNYTYTLAEGDRITNDENTDNKMFIPFVFKDDSGNVYSPQDIVDIYNEDWLDIESTSGIQLSWYGEIVKTGIHKGEIEIDSVGQTGIHSITISLLKDPSVKAQINIFVGSERVGQRLEFSKMPNSYMSDNTDNEMKVKVYDQYGEEFKPIPYLRDNLSVKLQLRAQSNTTGAGYGFTLSSNESNIPAQKYVLTPTLNDIEPSVSMPLEDFFNKSFKFYTKNAALGTVYTLKISLYEMQGTELIERSFKNTTIEVLDPSDSKNVLKYEAYVDYGVDNTVLAVGDYLKTTTNAVDVRANYPKFTKEIKVRALTREGYPVSVSNNVYSITSSNPTLTGVTYKYIAGLTAGTSKLTVQYKNIVGELHTTELDVTSKNEAPVVKSITLEKHNAMVFNYNPLSGLYIWDSVLGRKLTVMDQYGDEFISERAPGSIKTENGNGFTDQNIQKYESFLNLNYQISDVQGAWGYEKPKVTISSSGQILYILPDVLGFKVTVTAQSSKSDSLFVYIYR